MIFYMNKHFLSFILIFYFTNITTAHSQSVNYYKLTKKIENGYEQLNQQGGQFITFIGNLCYESDLKGIGVGHGVLKINSNYSTTYKTYIGDSYWGSNTIFRFSNDLTILNVCTNSDVIYVYKRIPAPQNVLTCSLIRKDIKNNINNQFSAVQQGATTIITNNTTNINSSTTINQNTLKKIRCHWCKGTGRITVDDNAPSNLGQRRLPYQCNECGKWINPNVFMHYHKQCIHCHGTGLQGL